MNAGEFRNELLAASMAIKDALDGYFVPACRRYGLTIQQFHVLAVLEGDGPQSVGELSGRVGVLRGNITAVCKKLEQRELIVRSRSPEDERVVVVTISGRGREVLNGLTGELESCCGEAFRQHPPEDMEDILKGLKKLCALVQKLRKE